MSGLFLTEINVSDWPRPGNLGCLLLISSDNNMPTDAAQLICSVSAYMSRIRIRNKWVTMRTVVRIRNSYICVWVSHVEFEPCANNTKSSHLIKIDTVGLCRPDVATDQDLHCLSLILSHITLNDVKPDQMLWKQYFFYDTAHIRAYVRL